MSAIAPRHYLQKINGKSFEECINFINEQSAALGVSTSGGNNIGEIMYAWAQYLSTESTAVESIFLEAVALIDASDPKVAFSKLSSLNEKLQGRMGWWERIFGGKDNELVNAIQSHPFYKLYQEESLANGFGYVQKAYDEFQQIDVRLNKVKGKLDGITSKLSSLTQPSFGLNDISLPGDMADNLAVVASIEETKKLIEQKPDLFYSPTATGNLANAAAIELYSIWEQSKFILDLAMSRWLIIAYFGLMLNAVVKHQISGQAFGHMIAASNAQLKEFGNLLTSVANVNK